MRSAAFPLGASPRLATALLLPLLCTLAQGRPQPHFEPRSNPELAPSHTHIVLDLTWNPGSLLSIQKNDLKAEWAEGFAEEAVTAVRLGLAELPSESSSDRITTTKTPNVSHLEPKPKPTPEPERESISKTVASPPKPSLIRGVKPAGQSTRERSLWKMTADMHKCVVGSKGRTQKELEEFPLKKPTNVRQKGKGSALQFVGQEQDAVTVTVTTTPDEGAKTMTIIMTTERSDNEDGRFEAVPLFVSPPIDGESFGSSMGKFGPLSLLDQSEKV